MGNPGPYKEYLGSSFVYRTLTGVINGKAGKAAALPKC